MRLAVTVLFVSAAVVSASAQRASTARTPWGDLHAPDGRIPPMTPDAQKRIAAAPAEERQSAR